MKFVLVRPGTIPLAVFAFYYPSYIASNRRSIPSSRYRVIGAGNGFQGVTILVDVSDVLSFWHVGKAWARPSIHWNSDITKIVCRGS